MSYIPENEKAYAAGLIDGEGCIQISVNNSKRWRKQHFIQITINMTDFDALEFMHQRWGGCIIKTKRNKWFLPHYKDSYRWAVSCGPAKKLINDIVPHLIIKKEQALVAMQLQTPPRKHKKLTDKEFEEREKLRQTLKDMKKQQFKVCSSA